MRVIAETRAMAEAPMVVSTVGPCSEGGGGAHVGCSTREALGRKSGSASRAGRWQQGFRGSCARQRGC